MAVLLGQLRDAAEAGGDDQHVELAIDFIADFVRSFPNVMRPQVLHDAFDTHVLPMCSPRCKFKVMDVRDLLTSTAACHPAAGGCRHRGKRAGVVC